MTTRFDNAPELGALSLEEHASVEAARGAVMALKKTFEHWLTILKGLEVLRHKAERIGGRQTFKRLREQAGLGKEIIPDATMTRGFDILERLPEVMTWRQTLTDRQQYEWASPSAVYKHCPLFAKDSRKPEMSPMEKLRQANIALQEENHKLKQREDGDRFKPTDTANDIAAVLVGMFTESKAEQIFRKGLQLLKAKPSRRSKAALDDMTDALNRRT
jgi:hypothetical protein